MHWGVEVELVTDTRSLSLARREAVVAVRLLRPTGPQGSARLLSAAEVVRELLRADGSFRDWINLSPVAVADEMTVLEVDYPDRTIQTGSLRA